MLESDSQILLHVIQFINFPFELLLSPLMDLLYLISFRIGKRWRLANFHLYLMLPIVEFIFIIFSLFEAETCIELLFF